MALDRLTKIDGGGISTTSDYRVGIITATKFIGPIEGDVTGSITATDGTFSGNVTIGGTLTYEDVTNIDSVGLITARDGIDCNGDLDVDGHTNLDNVSIAGVTTMSGNLTISNTDPRIIFVDTNNNPDFTLHANDGVMQVENSGSGTQVKLESSGSTRLFGNVIANKDLDVDGHTNLDNVSISGVATATTFVGALTGTASGNPTLTSGANNRVVTATGANALTGESNLTWDGSNLTSTVSGNSGIVVAASGNNAPQIKGQANRGAQNNTLLSMHGVWDGTDVAFIDLQAGPDTSNKDDGQIGFYTRPSGGSMGQRLHINSSGQIIINSSGTEAGTNTKLSVCATGSPGSNPSSIINNAVAVFRATGAAGHAASIGILAGNDGSSAVHFGDTDNDIIGRLLYNHTSGNTADYFEFYLQGSRRFRIQGNGNLCIGNDSNFTAGAKVEIRDTIGGGGGTGLILNDISSSGATEGLYIEWRSGTDKQADQCRIGQSSNATGSGSNFFIATNSGDTGSSTERFRITSTGRIGINESSPNATLHIKNADGANNRLELVHANDSANEQNKITFKNNTTEYASITSGKDGSNNSIGLVFGTGGTERLRIDSSGRLGVGVNSFHDSSTRLQLQSPGSDHTGIVITAAATSTLSYIYFGDTADKDIGRLVYENSSDSMQFWTNNDERLRIDSSGRLIIGHTATDDRDGYNSALQVSGTGGDDASITIGRWSNDASNPALVFSKSRNGTIGSHTVLQPNDYLGAIQFQGDDGSNYHVGASIQARVENFSGAADTDDMSTRILFNTNLDESNVGNRMIIHGRGSDYNVLYGGRVDILGYESQNITGGTNSNVLNEQLLICPSAASSYADHHTITFGQTKGDWYQGVNSGYNTSWGLLWNWGNTGYAATRVVRAGIHYDHRAQERFKFWSSYGDIEFKVDSGQSGNETAETCNKTAMRMTHDGYVLKPSQPIFLAHKSNGVRITGTGYVTFGQVHINNGSHYNSSNGRFTAPIAGHYFFYTKINAYNRLDMQLRVNGRTNPLDREYGQYSTDSDGIGWFSNVLQRIFYLDENEYVQVYISELAQNSDPGEWNTFGGWLVA